MDNSANFDSQGDMIKVYKSDNIPPPSGVAVAAGAGADISSNYKEPKGWRIFFLGWVSLHIFER